MPPPDAPPTLDPLDHLLDRAAEADDPDVRQWLEAMANGERAACDRPQPQQLQLRREEVPTAATAN
jgi:hypothetical protein